MKGEDQCRMPDKNRRIICLATFHIRGAQLNINIKVMLLLLFLLLSLNFGEISQTLAEILLTMNFTSMWDLSLCLVKNARDFPGQIVPLLYLYQINESSKGH